MGISFRMWCAGSPYDLDCYARSHIVTPLSRKNWGKPCIASWTREALLCTRQHVTSFLGVSPFIVEKLAETLHLHQWDSVPGPCSVPEFD